jgi:NADH:ubiquinone oxidoreductase subunit 4 (subunit M)
MPLFVSIFFVFTLANLSLPGTSSFVGEFLILVGVFQSNTVTTFLAATGMVLGGAYSLWLFNRISFGNLKIYSLGGFRDVDRREFNIFIPLLFLTFYMGIYPEVFLDAMRVSVLHLLSNF